MPFQFIDKTKISPSPNYNIMQSFLHWRHAFWVFCMCTSSTGALHGVPPRDTAFGRNYTAESGASPLESVISWIKGDPEEADSSSRKWLQYAEHQSRQIRALHSRKLPRKTISTSSALNKTSTTQTHPQFQSQTSLKKHKHNKLNLPIIFFGINLRCIFDLLPLFW